MTLLENSRLGSQTPRLCHLPEGVVSAAPGEAAIKLAASAGLHLDEWQQFVLRNSLGLRADGKWAAFSSCVIVPRQNGKGAVLEALALASLFLFENELTVWTAHQMKTAKEGFRRLVGHIVGTPDLHRHVAAIKRGNDDRGIELHDGRRIQFIARGTGGSGRGFTGDLIILDEAYELDGETMADILPTLSAVPNPQIWYTSSAPMATSEQLHRVRKRGVAGDDPRLAFFEWSIPEGADPLDPAVWPIANPAYPHRIDDEAIRAEVAEFAAEEDPSKFARERCGVPDDPPGESTLIDMAVWAAPPMFDAFSKIDTHHRIALDVSPDRKWAAFGAAGRRPDGKLHLEVVDRKPGTAWVLERGKDLATKFGPLRIQKGSPAESFIDLFTEAGVQVDEVTKSGHAQALGQFLDGVKPEADAIRHIGQEWLASALKVAQVQPSGDVEVLARRSSRADICALVACVIALGGVPATEPKKPVFAA